MSDGVNAGFARSEQLKAEWARLRTELTALPVDSPSHAARRSAIQARMAQITADMSAVLTETRKLIPTPDIDDAESDFDLPHVPPITCPEPFIQYSKNQLHVVQRTYDSSEDGDAGGRGDGRHNDDHGDAPAHGRVFNLEEEVPEAPVPTVLDHAQEDVSCYDVDELREQMMNGAELSPKTVVTVEARGGEKGIRAGLGELRHRLKDRLKMDSSGGSSLTEEERESLTLEQSRLEREARKLRRLPERSRQEQRRLEEVVAKIAKNAQKLSTGDQHSELEDDESIASMPSAGRKPSQRIERKKTALFGRASRIEKKDDLSDLRLDATEDNALTSKPTMDRANGADKGVPSKRKKGWTAFEAGMASIRGLGRSLRGVTKGKEKEVTRDSDDMSGRNEKTNKAAEDNLFVQTTQKVVERGEKLGAAAEGSEQMAHDAGDMLAAVRALKQRNQRGGLFS